MLQPLQLEEVSARYPNEIAELRDFLVKSGSAPATEQSLPAIVHRLQRDRAFHRDLTSHLWVIIHLAHRNISYADLLSVLAVAAAGPQFAAEAQEKDAHALLRFVLEARSALDVVPAQDVIPASPRQTPPARPVPPFSAPAPTPQPTQPAIPREEEPRTWQTRPTQFSSLDPEEPAISRKPLVWIAAACVFLALSIGLFLHFRRAPNQPVASTPEATSPTIAHGANPTPPAIDTPRPAPPETVPPETVPPETRTAHSTSRTTRERHTNKNLPARSPLPAYSPVPQPPTTAAAPPPAVITRPAPTQPLPPRPAPAVTATAPPKPTPAPTNSAQPDDRTNIARTYQPPRLVRRTPEERAELNPNTLNTTVHATTLGPTASSVLYSPVPAYPPAASAAHVQGEVKVQATVDRQGNVASVRVISGPPLLRAAALDAAQRWRFRPNMEAGEPTTMSATTVFAFQLP